MKQKVKRLRVLPVIGVTVLNGVKMMTAGEEFAREVINMKGYQRCGGGYRVLRKSVEDNKAY